MSVEIARLGLCVVRVSLDLQGQPTMINLHFDVASGSVVQVDRIDSKKSIDKKFNVHGEDRVPRGNQVYLSPSAGAQFTRKVAQEPCLPTPARVDSSGCMLRIR